MLGFHDNEGNQLLGGVGRSFSVIPNRPPSNPSLQMANLRALQTSGVLHMKNGWGLWNLVITLDNQKGKYKTASVNKQSDFTSGPNSVSPTTAP